MSKSFPHGIPAPSASIGRSSESDRDSLADSTPSLTPRRRSRDNAGHYLDGIRNRAYYVPWADKIGLGGISSSEARQGRPASSNGQPNHEDEKLNSSKWFGFDLVQMVTLIFVWVCHIYHQVKEIYWLLLEMREWIGEKPPVLTEKVKRNIKDFVCDKLCVDLCFPASALTAEVFSRLDDFGLSRIGDRSDRGFLEAVAAIVGSTIGTYRSSLEKFLFGKPTSSRLRNARTFDEWARVIMAGHWIDDSRQSLFQVVLLKSFMEAPECPPYSEQTKSTFWPKFALYVESLEVKLGGSSALMQWLEAELTKRRELFVSSADVKMRGQGSAAVQCSPVLKT